MSSEKHIAISHLCSLYEIEMSFFDTLKEMGLVKLATINNRPHIERDATSEVERMIRLHRDLSINPEGIDVVFNLLQKLEHLEEEMIRLRRKLSIYEAE